MTHAPSSSYHCFAIELDGRDGSFGLPGSWEDPALGPGPGPGPGPDRGCRVPDDLPITASFRPLPALSCLGGVQSVAHVTFPIGSPLGGTGGATLPLTLLQCCAGGGGGGGGAGTREVWMQVGTERVVALSQLSIINEVDDDGLTYPETAQVVPMSLSSQTAKLWTCCGGGTTRLLASIDGSCFLLGTNPTLDPSLGHPDVLLSILSALCPEQGLSPEDCNAIGGLAVGVLWLAGKAYGHACSTYYLLCAALGLPFPALPPPTLSIAASTTAPEWSQNKLSM